MVSEHWTHLTVLPHLMIQVFIQRKRKNLCRLKFGINNIFRACFEIEWIWEEIELGRLCRIEISESHKNTLPAPEFVNEPHQDWWLSCDQNLIFCWLAWCGVKSNGTKVNINNTLLAERALLCGLCQESKEKAVKASSNNRLPVMRKAAGVGNRL